MEKLQKYKKIFNLLISLGAFLGLAFLFLSDLSDHSQIFLILETVFLVLDVLLLAVSAVFLFKILKIEKSNKKKN